MCRKRFQALPMGWLCLGCSNWCKAASWSIPVVSTAHSVMKLRLIKLGSSNLRVRACGPAGLRDCGPAGLRACNSSAEWARPIEVGVLTIYSDCY